MRFKFWLLEDEQTVSRLLVQWMPLIQKLARLHAHQANDADDIAQNAAIGVFKALRKDNLPDNPQTWLFSVVRNAAYDFYRKFRHKAGELPEQLPTEDDPSRAIQRGELQQQVRGALGELDPIHRDILIQRYYDERPEEDIARQLGIPKGTAKSRANAARRALKGRLDPEI